LKIIKAEAEFTAEQLNIIKELAAETGLCEQTVCILYGRGVDTADKIEGFMNPSRKRFLSPFLMSGMDEAVSLIKRARDEEWSVVVYGDYDADGICATTIMARSLADFGINAYVYVPERTQGYGLGISAIDDIFEQWFPQLFITVDCGISNAKEVEYIKEQGAEVIITDHHELPSVLPDCICVNPKFDDDYPYDNLCGAGVALKVGCALNGNSAYSYLDFAAIATVADSVPIVGENRDLVAEGLRLINASPRKNYSFFLGKNGEAISAQTLAFSVAPKINAAGRMGDANAALKLFLESDEKVIYDTAVKLGEYNLERQKYCDDLYLSAKSKIKEKGANSRIIILWDGSWNTGFVGIVAARLAEEYSRPALLFVRNGDMLKGSARSVEGVNIYDALKSCEDLIAEFGGHSQAAGVNVSLENLPLLEERLNEYMHERYSVSSFTPTYYINGEISSLSRKFVMELERLEPFGVGNRRPVFVMQTGALPARAIKAGSPHLTIKTDLIEMMYFSGAKYASLLRSGLPKKLVFEYNVSVYKQRQYIKGFIRDVVYSAKDCSYAKDGAIVNGIKAASSKKTNCKISEISYEKACEMLADKQEYGSVFILNDINNLARYDVGEREVNVFTPSSGNLASIVLVSPQQDCDLSGYENIVYLDDPHKITLPSLSGKTVFVCGELDGLAPLSELETQREELLDFFRYLASAPVTGSFENAEECALSLRIAAPMPQVYFALKVFEELKLISFSGGKLTVNRGVKTQLTNSQLYNFVTGMKS